jgi:hypothetical protein
MARRRRRNPTTFFHEHPWMTFFLGGGALYTMRVIFRGWEPDPFAEKPTAAAPALTAASTPSQTTAAIAA